MENIEAHGGDAGPWTLKKGDGPIIATAVHDGHDLRPEVAEIMKLTEAERLREEDPYTSSWVDIVDTQIVALRSRFEMDLNRPREQAIYRDPDDAWGLDVWSTRPSDEIVERSLAQYDAYYEMLRAVCDEKRERHGKFVLYDIHSYNHRRHGEERDRGRQRVDHASKAARRPPARPWRR